jgi:thioredoxin 1
MALKQVTDTNFATEVLESSTPVLVDFWAEWCGPCKMLMPILEEMAPDMASKVKIVKVNIDQNPQTPSQFGVRGVPTMILFKDGAAVATKVGVAPKSTLVSWIEGNL